MPTSPETPEQMAETLDGLADSANWGDAKMSALRAGAAALRAQGRETGQWLPIETAPKDGTVIDIWCVSSDSVDRWRETNCIWRHDRGLWSNGNGMWDCATHWSLLLPPVSTESALTSPPVTQK